MEARRPAALTWAACWLTAVFVAGACTDPSPQAPAPGASTTTAALPKEILTDLTRWDAATSQARRAAAEDVARRLPDFSLLRLETFSCGGQTHEVAIYTHAKTGMEFVLVPGGTFLMGSPADESMRNAPNETQHRVTLSPFLLARTELTQGVWRRFVGDWHAEFSDDDSDDKPVMEVTWDEVVGVLPRLELSLPTEAQWEYACRAGTTTAYFTGASSDTLLGYANLDERDSLAANRSDADPEHAELFHGRVPDGFASPAPVASFRPNAFGLYDMVGNVAEWCADGSLVYLDPDALHGVKYEDYPPGPARDPLRAPRLDDFDKRIFRGGSWLTEAYEGRSADRGTAYANDAERTIGFRPAKTVPMEE